MEIINRKEAKEKKLKYYFTGKVCPNNHISKRSTHNATCYACKCESRRKAEKKNRGVANARKARYEYSKIKRTPSWTDLIAITEFYKACPKGMAVDHIIPLQGKNVSGLHVINNLQYLTKSENSSKSNNFEPEFTS